MAAKKINRKYQKFQKFQVGGGKGSPSRDKMRKATDGDDQFLRLIKLMRNQGDEFGFAVRGGHEHNLGFFISEVVPDSIAERAGLQVGDEVMRVNGLSLEQTVMPDLVRLVKNRDNLVLRVRDSKNVPAKAAQSELKWSAPSEFTPDLLNIVPVEEYLSDRHWSREEMSSPTSSSMSSEPSDVIPEQPDIPAPPAPLIHEMFHSSGNNYGMKLNKNPNGHGMHLHRKDSSGGYSSSSDGASTSAFDDSRSDTTSNDGSEKHKSDSSDIRAQLQNELSIKLMAQRRKLEKIPPETPKTAHSNPVKPVRHNINTAESPASQRLDQALNIETQQRCTNPKQEEIPTSNSRQFFLRREAEHHNQDSGHVTPPPVPQKSRHPPPILKSSPAVPKRQPSAISPVVTHGPKDFNLSALKDVSSALNKIHENCDPNLLFTQDQLKGRRVEVINIAKNLLSKALHVSNGRVYLRLQDQNGISKKGMEEILMAEGFALTSGFTESQVSKILEKFSHQQTVKLIVAKNC